jgi:hypothetical protein
MSKLTKPIKASFAYWFQIELAYLNRTETYKAAFSRHTNMSIGMCDISRWPLNPYLLTDLKLCTVACSNCTKLIKFILFVNFMNFINFYKFLTEFLRGWGVNVIERTAFEVKKSETDKVFQVFNAKLTKALNICASLKTATDIS